MEYYERPLEINMNKEYNKINEWLNSGEYISDIDDMRTTIMRNCMMSENEATTASIFEAELYYLIRSRTGIKINYEKEKALGNVHKFCLSSKNATRRGRMDAVVNNNLVIEYKHNSKLKTTDQIDEAIIQVVEYLNALYRNENKKYSAILTDGIKIGYFSFVGDKVCYSALSTISADDIDYIIRGIVYYDTKKFVPENIVKDFAISSQIDSISKSVALSLYQSLKCASTEKTQMLYEEWKRLMHLSIDDNGKGNDIEKRRTDLSLIFSDTIDTPEKEYMAFYALQTTYAIIVKLIACKVVDKLEYNDNTKHYYDLTTITSNELQVFFEKMEDGYSYKSNNIFNFLEGDFFSWYSDKNQWSTEFWNLILNTVKCIDQYSSFSFNVTYQPIDIFKDLYMSIIPKSFRHSMGEYFTPEWLADYVVSESINDIENEWKAIDPCCGSGIFIISLIKHIVGDVDIKKLTDSEKLEMRDAILNRVYGIDINPLSVLSARVGYYLALLPFGKLSNIEIPIYLGDSAIIPVEKKIGEIDCYTYSISNMKNPFEVVLPKRFVKTKDFGKVMSQLQACVKTDDENILYSVIEDKLTQKEKESKELTLAIKKLAKNLITLHRNNWDGIWIRISTNFMLIARLNTFDLIVGNPPWVKWEHLPAMYANRIKELCNIKHIFSNDGQFGGTQLNICALISNVTASNWLKDGGLLAFLMPDSLMSQNSYEGFRDFYIDFDRNERLYLQRIDKWIAPLRPFRCDDRPITQDFNTYYYSSNYVNYKLGIPVKTITRLKSITDDELNKCNSFPEAKEHLVFENSKAFQLSDSSTAFSYSSKEYDFSKIIGPTSYLYRTGVEFTPQELYMLVGCGKSDVKDHYCFKNKRFQLSKYRIKDTPKNGWTLPTTHIYPIVTGPSIEPFRRSYNNEFCILPYTKDNTTDPITIDTMISENNELFNYLVNHKDLIDKQSEKSKSMHRGDEFYALSKIGPYTFAKNIVAARDNSKFCATVVKPSKTPWGEVKQTICVKHTIIISQDKSGRFITSPEAYYICGILNSAVVIEYIHNSFKKNGFSLNKSNLYIPLFDKSNPLHRTISSTARRVSSNTQNINRIQRKLSNLYLRICEEHLKNDKE